MQSMLLKEDHLDATLRLVLHIQQLALTSQLYFVNSVEAPLGKKKAKTAPTAQL